MDQAERKERIGINCIGIYMRIQKSHIASAGKSQGGIVAAPPGDGYAGAYSGYNRDPYCEYYTKGDGEHLERSYA